MQRIRQQYQDLNVVKKTFEKLKGNSGARNIKTSLFNEGIIMSRRKIRRLMEEQNLISVYGKPKYTKPGTIKADSNKANVSNLLGRQFSGWKENEVVVSDLTYVKVNNKWCYICVLLDLFNREIVGWSVGENKRADLVLQAFKKSGISWRKVMIFHTDRGMEFCSRKIDKFLNENGIIRSLSRPGTPIDNAICESFYKTVKKEFIKKQSFSSLKRLELFFGDWVHWYNKIRFHSANGNLSPIDYKQKFNRIALKKIA